MLQALTRLIHMIKKVTIAAMLGILSSNVMAYGEVRPENLTKIPVSSTDVNRIKCGDGLITGIHYSQDKNIAVEVKESNAYIKFLAMQQGSEITYSERASEFFVTCGGEVYELILLPKIMNAKTIYLSNPIKNKIKENISSYNELPLEDQIVKFSVALLSDDENILQQFNVKNYKATDQNWFDFDKYSKVGKIKSFSVDGIGIKVSEYRLISKKGRRFNPTEFLDSRLGENILGVTVDPEVVNANDPLKLIIVEKDVKNEL
jgi:hypothetical protein